jgi:hypothetical protein
MKRHDNRTEKAESTHSGTGGGEGGRKGGSEGVRE